MDLGMAHSQRRLGHGAAGRTVAGPSPPRGRLYVLPKDIIAFPGNAPTEHLIDKAHTLGIPVQRVAA